MDGKILRLSEPLYLKQLLLNFPGVRLKLSGKSSDHLFPAKIQSVEIEATGPNTAAVKRIKVVMTKKQLQELVSNRVSPAKIVFGREKACCTNPAENWKPMLTSVPEEIELNSM